MDHSKRYGRFTSSKIFNLLKPAKKGEEWAAPALTYIEEKRLERKLKRGLDTGHYSQDTAWGLIMERRVIELLDFSYSLNSQETLIHPEHDFWAGSPDLISNDSIADIKAYQPKHFAIYAECLLVQDIEIMKNDFPQEYWQLVSNSIIANKSHAEAILYMPYESEHSEIIELINSYEGDDIWKYRFIAEKSISELAFLPDDSEFPNLIRFKFEVPQEDRDLLTKKVLEAEKLISIDKK